jgi:hypothetical protein
VAALVRERTHPQISQRDADEKVRSQNAEVREQK